MRGQSLLVLSFIQEIPSMLRNCGGKAGGRDKWGDWD